MIGVELFPYGNRWLGATPDPNAFRITFNGIQHTPFAAAWGFYSFIPCLNLYAYTTQPFPSPFALELRYYDTNHQYTAIGQHHVIKPYPPQPGPNLL